MCDNYKLKNFKIVNLTPWCVVCYYGKDYFIVYPEYQSYPSYNITVQYMK